MRTILLADDDADVRDGVGRLLRFKGYETVLVGDGRVALDLIGGPGGEPDLVLMDVTMPGLDGLAATRRLRASGCTVPILMLTGRDAVGDRIVALDNGADDYLAKPFAVEELPARVRALLRRSPRRPVPDEESGPCGGLLEFQDVVLDPATRAVARGERVLDLTKTEFANPSLHRIDGAEQRGPARTDAVRAGPCPCRGASSRGREPLPLPVPTSRS